VGEIGEAFSTQGMNEKCIQYFGLGDMKGRDHMEDLSIYRNTVLNWILG